MECWSAAIRGDMELIRANCGHNEHDCLLFPYELVWKDRGAETDLNSKEYNKITRVAKVDWAGASSRRKCGWEPVPMGFLFNCSTPCLR